MPEISEKELDRYKRIEKAARDHVSEKEYEWMKGVVAAARYHVSEKEYDETRYPMHSGLVKALKPVSNRPTRTDLGGYWDAERIACQTLEALRNECMEQGVKSKVQAIINKWIEEYKAER